MHHSLEASALFLVYVRCKCTPINMHIYDVHIHLVNENIELVSVSKTIKSNVMEM